MAEDIKSARSSLLPLIGPVEARKRSWAGLWRQTRGGFVVMGLVALLGLGEGLGAAPVQAQDGTSGRTTVGRPDRSAISSPGRLRAPKKDWSFTIGGLGYYSPTYEGSDSSDFSVFPYLDIRWRNRLFLSARDGLGGNLVATPDFTLGGAFNYYWGRNDDDDDVLNGMEDIEGGIEGSLFAKLRHGPWGLNATLRQGLTGSDSGTVFTIGGGYTFMPMDNLRLVLNADASLVSGNYANTWFGISSSEAAASSLLSAYEAEAGWKDYGLGLTAIYSWNKRWGLMGLLKFKRLQDNVADSPLVKTVGSENQISGGLGLTYRF